MSHDAQMLPVLVRHPVGDQSHAAHVRVRPVEEGDITEILGLSTGIDQGSSRSADLIPESGQSGLPVGLRFGTVEGSENLGEAHKSLLEAGGRR